MQNIYFCATPTLLASCYSIYYCSNWFNSWTPMDSPIWMGHPVSTTPSTYGRFDTLHVKQWGVSSYDSGTNMFGYNRVSHHEMRNKSKVRFI